MITVSPPRGASASPPPASPNSPVFRARAAATRSPTRSALSRPPPPIRPQLSEHSEPVRIVDHQARDEGVDEEELIARNGGKMPWDHHLDAAQFLEPKSPDIITRAWLSPVQRPRLGIGGKHTKDFDKLDLSFFELYGAVADRSLNSELMIDALLTYFDILVRM